MREHYAPFEIGNRFRILPPDTPLTEDGRFNLTMDRGAFGSGEHETTRSCIEILETLPQVRAAKVLDLGSGTGILSIAALMLGADVAYCVDIEEDAVDACKRNCERNGVNQNIHHLCGTLNGLDQAEFDLVLANIYGDILLVVADDLVNKAKPGATILLSGILWEFNFDVRQRYERLGCEVVRNRMLEEFSTIVLRKGKCGDAGPG